MTIRLKIILYKPKLMLYVLFKLLGIRNCPPHFLFYNAFVTSFHRTRKQPRLEGNSKDHLIQPLSFNLVNHKIKSSQHVMIFWFADSTWIKEEQWLNPLFTEIYNLKSYFTEQLLIRINSSEEELRRVS